ncbi:hypothetical protein VTK56DRAFT_5516 [Thermocarpiscus australiensis]
MSALGNAEEMDSEAIEWHPTVLIRDSKSLEQNQRVGFALIVLNQPLYNHLDVIRRLWDNASVRIAADGGANCLYEVAGQHGDSSFDDLRAIIGDLDSLTPQTQAYYERPGRTRTEVIRDPDQYSTDFGKAVHYVRAECPGLDIVAVGGLGGRVDQGLSQLHHLYLFQTDPRYAAGRMYLFTGESLTFLLKGGRQHRIRVRDGEAHDDVFGKYVGILPVKEPSRITTRGLEWDVTDWETAFGGQLSTSNHVLPETQVVEVFPTKDVLFTIALRGRA